MRVGALPEEAQCLYKTEKGIEDAFGALVFISGNFRRKKIGVIAAKYSGFPGRQLADLQVLWRKNETISYACCVQSDHPHFGEMHRSCRTRRGGVCITVLLVNLECEQPDSFGKRFQKGFYDEKEPYTPNHSPQYRVGFTSRCYHDSGRECSYGRPRS